jgi:hypothetical protein
LNGGQDAKFNKSVYGGSGVCEEMGNFKYRKYKSPLSWGVGVLGIEPTAIL